MKSYVLDVAVMPSKPKKTRDFAEGKEQTSDNTASPTKQGRPWRRDDQRDSQRPKDGEPVVLNLRTRVPPGKPDIDPLRIGVWTAFAVVLVLAWAGIVLLVMTFR